MPPHLVLADILLKFQVQIHQVTPNAIVQLSKYIWAVTSFGGILSAEGFAKRYELHYKPRKIEVDGDEVQGQYGCLNFHAKHRSHRAKLTVAVKNKWSGAWMQAWFYCKVPLLWSPSHGRGKGIYAMCSDMTGLDFSKEPPFECTEDDAGDVAFIKVTRSIVGRDVVEEYMACMIFPLSTNFSLGEIASGEMPVSMLTLPLPKFPVARLPGETTDGFRARVELVAVNVVWRYARGEHDACILVVLNGGRVNRVFEQADVPYMPRLVPRSEASKEAEKKEKRRWCRACGETHEGVRPKGPASKSA
jgi:hypothetical protein